MPAVGDAIRTCSVAGTGTPRRRLIKHTVGMNSANQETVINTHRYGPWAVIAGGSEGVGQCFARRLAAAGLNLVLIARKPEPLDECADAVKDYGVEVRTIAADLTVGQDRARITDQTAELDVGLLIYNAGSNTYGHEFVTGDLE